MSFDAWVVGFGLSRVLIELNLVESPWAYSVMAATILIDAYLLYIFFTVSKPATSGDRNEPSNSLLRTWQTPVVSSDYNDSGAEDCRLVA